jgi:ABC-type multidrug transport system ATPase subunit
MIKIHNLTKNFYPPFSLAQLLRLGLNRPQPVRALGNVSFEVKRAQALGILGLNGAGKTTLLKIISTLILPDTGSVRINGYSVGTDDLEIKSLIGLASSEERSFYWRLTGRQNLEFFACLHGISKKKTRKKIDELFETFRIDYQDKRFDSYSTGMKRKFELLRVLVHDPSILLLDEPTKSLDMRSTVELRSLLKGMIKERRTIILATHDIEEVKDLCDTFMILKKGSVYGFGTLEELRKKLNSPQASLNEIYLEAIKDDA